MIKNKEEFIDTKHLNNYEEKVKKGIEYIELRSLHSQLFCI